MRTTCPATPTSSCRSHRLPLGGDRAPVEPAKKKRPRPEQTRCRSSSRCSQLTFGTMAAVRSLRVSVKSDSGSDRSESDSESESDRDARDAEPMEVEEGELGAEDVSVSRSLKELLPVSGRSRPGSGRGLAEPREAVEP